MPRPLSMDLRQRIHAAVESGLSRNAAAKHFSVGISTVIRLEQAFKATGSLEPKQMGGYRTAVLAPHAAVVRALVAETPDATLSELGKALRKQKIKVGQTALWNFLAQLRLTYKKTSARQRTGSA